MSVNLGIAIGEEEKNLPEIFRSMDLVAAKKRLSIYTKETEKMLVEANEIPVETEEQNARATEIGTTAMSLFKKIEATRKEIIAEPEEYIDKVNAIAKILTEKLYSGKKGVATVVSILKSKQVRFVEIQEQRRREAEALARKETEKLQKKLDKQAEKKGIEPVKIEAPVIPKGDTVTRTEQGSSFSSKRWTFKITDEKLIPRMYLKVDEQKIRNDVNHGMRQIPGIEIFEETSISYRT